jgi:hypothetical protein
LKKPIQLFLGRNCTGLKIGADSKHYSQLGILCENKAACSISSGHDMHASYEREVFFLANRLAD